MKLRYTPRARGDIASIHDYIAKHNRQAASAVVRGIRATGRLLARYPRAGRQSNIPDVRVMPVKRFPYIIYHRISDQEVEIIHVRHGARRAPWPEEL